MTTLSPCDVAAIAAAVDRRYQQILQTEGSATGPIKLHLTELEARCRRLEIENKHLRNRVMALTDEALQIDDDGPTIAELTDITYRCGGPDL